MRRAPAVAIAVAIFGSVCLSPASSYAAFGSSTSTTATFSATTIAPTTNFSASTLCALTWTATTSTWATGYKIERYQSGNLQATHTVSGAGTASYTEHGLALTTYTWKIYAYKGTWMSSIQQSTAIVVLCV